MISERRLKKWRRIALLTKDVEYSDQEERMSAFILELTQELLDQRLIEQAKKEKK